MRRDHTEGGRESRNLVQSRNGSQVLQKGGSPERNEEGAHRVIHKQKSFPKPLAWKIRGAGFHEYLKPVGLEDWSFKGLHVWMG